VPKNYPNTQNLYFDFNLIHYYAARKDITKHNQSIKTLSYFNFIISVQNVYASATIIFFIIVILQFNEFAINYYPFKM